MFEFLRDKNNNNKTDSKINFNPSNLDCLLTGLDQPSLDRLNKKMSILEKAISGDSFIIIDNDENEIELASKKLKLNYEVSTVYGDRRIIFNPNDIINSDFNVVKMYNTNFKKILIIGDAGTSAYPILRWQIWNIENNKHCLWVDKHSNDNFIQKQMKDNITFKYVDDFNFNIDKFYDVIFINGLRLKSTIDKLRSIKIPLLLRVGTKDLDNYSLKELSKIFDLIIISSPNKYDEQGKSIISNLFEDNINIEKLNQIDDILLVNKDLVHFTKIKFPKDFPLSLDNPWI